MSGTLLFKGSKGKMEHEASAIARRVRNYIVLANESQDDTKAIEDDGVFKNMILIFLMGAAVFLTQATLIVVKGIKRIEA